MVPYVYVGMFFTDFEGGVRNIKALIGSVEIFLFIFPVPVAIIHRLGYKVVCTYMRNMLG